MISTLILAAGESKRMESPKALLTVGGITFAEEIARKATEAGAVFVYVIAGAHYQEIKQKLNGIEVLWNTRYKQGQLSSLKEGLHNLPTGSMEVLVWPVDQPLVTVETVRRLISAFQNEGKPITIPVSNGRRGHPVLYNIHAIHKALSLGARQTAKDLLTFFADQVCLVDVDDPAVLIDIDTPEDYQKYVKSAGL